MKGVRDNTINRESHSARKKLRIADEAGWQSPSFQRLPEGPFRTVPGEILRKLLRGLSQLPSRLESWGLPKRLQYWPKSIQIVNSANSF